MRYSLLVTICQMGQTLQEAARYLRTAPQGPLREELVQNGRQMLAQMRGTLEQHRGDLRSEAPLAALAGIGAAWEGGGTELTGPEEQLAQFLCGLPQQVNTQVRAVFFAELGEKWDAMQSVYETMRADPRFDPVVVRTPVFRVVQEAGEQKQEIIYKDFLTPMGIPALGYDEYDIAADCPELAFSSQPYESCTLPQFWPESIAKHTRLVYLSYFLPDILGEHHTNTLAQMPVYRHAWKVICSGKKHHAFYCRHAENGGVNALVTGLPKTDPLVALRETSLPLPAGWEKLRGKTVFLWNSWYDMGVSSLRYFEALMDWFGTHKDCALIWRPHPLSDIVARLYYPAQYPVFQRMLQWAEQAENVLLDKEVSCFAAFSVSRAMLSDQSSLLPQYLLLDKPALWIRNDALRFTGEEFIDSRWMEQTTGPDGIRAFLERIRNGEDRGAELRRAILRRDLPLADGHCGERVCEAVWDALHKESLPYCR